MKGRGHLNPGVKLIGVILAVVSFILAFTGFTLESQAGQYTLFSQRITIDSDAMIGNGSAPDPINFPFLLKLSDSLNPLFSYAQTDGDDIFFTDAAGVRIDHEIVKYDAVAKEFLAWVRIPVLSAIADTDIFMYYGNPNASNQGNPEGVWDGNYVMVQHLDETSGQHLDSTIQHNDSTVVNVTAQGTAGKIGGADEFTADKYVSIPDNNSIDLVDNNGALTLSAWVSTRSLGAEAAGVAGIISKTDGGAGYTLRIDGPNCGSGSSIVVSGSRSGNWSMVCATNALNTNNWYYLTFTYDPFNPSDTNDDMSYIYINGDLNSFRNSPVEIANSPTDLRIGEWMSVSFDGFIDEVRISNTDRSADWIRAEYNNQNGSIDYLAFAEGGTQNCTDNDNDGYAFEGGLCGLIDCDDSNANVNPGATEICNGIDDNCDGQINEGLTIGDYYRDADSDDYGNPLDSIHDCAVPGYVPDNTDCNDSNATVNPGGYECGDCIDNDADGNIDYPADLECSSTTDSYEDSLKDGLVGYWRLNEESGTAVYDSSVLGNNGQLVGALRTTDGKVGSAVQFSTDGTYVEIPDDNSLDLVNNFTVSLWIRGNDTSGTLVSKGVYCAGPRAWSLTSYQTGFGLDYSKTGNIDSVTTSKNIFLTNNRDDWHYVALIYDNGTAKFYLDGESFESITIGQEMWSNGSPLRIGYFHCGGNDPNYGFNGAIDEVRLYNKVLSNDDVLQLYIAEQYNSGNRLTDLTQPTSPQNLTAVSNYTNRVDLTWLASTDYETDVKGYEIYRNGEHIATKLKTEGSATEAYADVIALSPATIYTYEVYAFDVAGNSSNVSNAVSVTTQPASAVLKVFPGAEGFGTETPAGRGGTIYRVTNLNDSGDGSLRNCINASGNRVCIFEVSGTIALTNELHILNPFITIAGQTAPSPGITITGATFKIMTHDVLMQHISVRVGDDLSTGHSGPGNRDSLSIGDSVYNVVIDHCSFSWAIDEIVEFWINYVYDVTLSNSIISEGLNNSLHPKGKHSTGLLIGGVKQISVIKNLLAHNGSRNPLISQDTSSLVANNLVYNMGPGSPISFNFNDNYLNNATNSSIIANLVIKGINSPNNSFAIGINTDVPDTSLFYTMGNSCSGELLNDPWSCVYNLKGGSVKAFVPPVWDSSLKILPVNEVENYIKSNAGPRPADRGVVDSRIISELENRTGQIIDCVHSDNIEYPTGNLESWDKLSVTLPFDGTANPINNNPAPCHGRYNGKQIKVIDQNDMSQILTIDTYTYNGVSICDYEYGPDRKSGTATIVGGWNPSEGATYTYKVINNCSNSAEARGAIDSTGTTRALLLPDNPNEDSDNDGYTNLEEWLNAYSREVEESGFDCNNYDKDGDGYTSIGGPCGPVDPDDNDNTVYPGAPEICDGKDNDGNGLTDEDADGDGYTVCAEDCNNIDATMYPGAPEICDGKDNNCDGNLDDIDSDGDGYTVCTGDCNDNDPDVNPGATEIFDDIDNNCDGIIALRDPLTWYNTDWKHRQPVIISAGMTSANLAYFPMLVKITDPESTLFSQAQADGNDIVFTSSDGITKLDHEIEKYDTASGVLVAWVKLPSLSASWNTIYMYYGNPNAANQEYPEGVWDGNYVMVQHLDETSGQHLDSTSYSNDSTEVNVSAQGTAGKIGGADEFNAGKYLTIPDSDALDLVGNNGKLTLSAWVYARTSGEGAAGVAGIISKTDGGAGYTLRIDGPNCGLGSSIVVSGSRSGNWRMVCATNALNTNNWYYLTFTYDPFNPSDTYDDMLYIYINGDLNSFRNSPVEIANSPTDLRIGEWLSASFDGFIDEVRISNTDRSADWIKAEYRNQTTYDDPVQHGYVRFDTQEIFCTDSDNDGYAVEGGACGLVDCNDNDAAINPGATEICDGIDNDCDGQVDEVPVVITPLAGDNGSISPDMPQTLSCYGNGFFTVTPDTRYYIESVTGCNGALLDNTYTTGQITADCTVTAAFAQYITVTVPDGGESLARGTNQTISWTYAGNPGADVKIELLKGGVLNRTISSLTSIGSGGAGSYNWHIPNGQAVPLGTDYTIRVTSTTNDNAYDTSNGDFAITE